MGTVASNTDVITTPDDWERIASLGRRIDYQTWLELQCTRIAAVTTGLLAIRAGSEPKFRPVAIWPAETQSGDTPLAPLIDEVIEQRSGLILPLKTKTTTAHVHYGVAYPVLIDDRVVAVVAVSLAPVSEAALKHAMHQLQWGSAWLELALRRQEVAEKSQDLARVSDAVDLFSVALSEPHFEGAAMRLVAELANRSGCELVCLGYRKGGRMRLDYLSSSSRFGKETNLARATEAAMNEAADQGQRIVYNGSQTAVQAPVSQAHRQLAEQQRDASLLTIPLFLDMECVGALNFQRNDLEPFTENEADYYESVAALAVSALEEKRNNDRPLARRIVEAAADSLGKLFGAGHWRRKLLAAAVVLLGLFAYFAHGSYRLSADAIVEAESQRVIVAPFDGFIEAAPVTAGDRTERGNLLVSLDDRDLRLEQLKWQSQANRLQKQYQEAIAGNERSRINIVEAQLEQAAAQLTLIEAQLERARQMAPFDGLIVSGDLRQRLGGAVSQGDVLFQISPIDAYKVTVQIPEQRIGDVRVGQRGRLYLSALPHGLFEIEVKKIRPLAQAGDGKSFFIVEASLAGDNEQIQPGMEGVVKIYIDERRRVAIWTRGAAEWLRLKLWAWWG